MKNENFLTATQIAEKFSILMHRTLKSTDIQEALRRLGYVKKVGKKYIPTSEKGYFYCIEKELKIARIIKKYYLWDIDILNEILEEIR